MSGLPVEDPNLVGLALSLRQTLEPNTRASGNFSDLGKKKKIIQKIVNRIFFYIAEKQLEVEEQRPNFSISLLQLVTNDTLEMTVRTAAALLFKNYIKRNWNWVGI